MLVLPSDGSPPDSAPAAEPSPELPTASCPKDPPQLAAGCPASGQICPYAPKKDGQDPSPGCHTVFRCEAGRWLQIVGCLQTMAGCPDQAPARGAACSSAVKGQNCYYEARGKACEESSIAQCDGAAWRHVNGCPTREEGGVQETCVIQPTLDPEPVFEKPGKQVDAPALAVAGTQVMVAMVVSAGKDSAHGTYLHRLDSSRPQDEKKLIWPSESMLYGRDPSSSPALAFARDRFILAWIASDGWPLATDHQPGAFVRGIPLSGDPASKEVLVDAKGSTISGLALLPETRGWLAYRHLSPHDAGKSAVSLVALGPDLAPLPSSRKVVADEGAPLEWHQSPIPVAFARIARRSSGFVVASPVAASGDYTDDSGLQVCFHEDAAAADTCARLPVGYPARMSLAALHDGSAVLAYAGVGWDKTPPAVAPFRIERVLADGKASPISNIIVDSGTLAAGPYLVPFDRGFAVAWTTVKDPDKQGGTLHLRLFKVQPSGLTSHPSVGEIKKELPELRSYDRMAIAYAHTDRSLHLAWSINGADGLSRVYRQRLICGASN